MTTCLLVSALAPGCDDPPGAGRSYVLVHGAFMDDTGWTAAAARLRDAGADVATPLLPAHGSDPTPASGAALAGYVDRVSAAIDAAGRPVTLVGHSMAGIVISQVAEQRGADIAELVYVAAYLPSDGQSLLDLAMTDAGSELGAHLVFNPDGTIDVGGDAFVSLFCDDCPPAEADALRASYRAEPAAPLAEPVTLSAPGFGAVPKTYVHTLRDRVVSPALQERMAGTTPIVRHATLDTSHAAMLAAPGALADLLLGE